MIYSVVGGLMSFLIGYLVLLTSVEKQLKLEYAVWLIAFVFFLLLDILIWWFSHLLLIMIKFKFIQTHLVIVLSLACFIITEGWVNVNLLTTARLLHRLGFAFRCHNKLTWARQRHELCDFVLEFSVLLDDLLSSQSVELHFVLLKLEFNVCKLQR